MPRKLTHLTKLTHIDRNNAPAMVDVSGKLVTRRTAIAQARMRLPDAVHAAFKNGELVTAKGPVFHTAIIAGTQAVKKTAELIPFCHTLPIEHCSITITVEDIHLLLTCKVAATARTGVEMEALTGVSIAALTVYDMAKALSHDMVIEEIALVAKTGGKRTIDKRKP
jgi:cyclic pyranopterin phosphate synthase